MSNPHTGINNIFRLVVKRIHDKWKEREVYVYSLCTKFVCSECMALVRNSPKYETKHNQLSLALKGKWPVNHRSYIVSKEFFVITRSQLELHQFLLPDAVENWNAGH